MEVVAVPPFERFYGEHAGEVLGYLRRLLGQRAEDAWQETFLRALRSYDRLEHGRHLRAWVFTIATNVAMDDLRRKSRTAELVDEVPDLAAAEPSQSAFEELEHLTGDLPPTERAAVVLRYGYDLPYAEIGAALGSSEEAARAAASSGVRRLRARTEMTLRRSGAMGGAREGRREPQYPSDIGATEDAASRRPARPSDTRLRFGSSSKEEN